MDRTVAPFQLIPPPSFLWKINIFDAEVIVMGDLNSAYEIETVKKIYAALNRDDVSAFLTFFDAKIERFETFGGRFHGLAELQANFSQGRGKWAEGSCEPEKFTIVNGKVVVFVHVRVRLKNESEWIDAQVTDVFRFQDSKVAEFHSFSDRTEALQWAGGTRG